MLPDLRNERSRGRFSWTASGAMTELVSGLQEEYTSLFLKGFKLAF